MTTQQETVVPSGHDGDDPHPGPEDGPQDDPQEGQQDGPPDGPLDGIAAIQDWSVGYVKRHPARLPHDGRRPVRSRHPHLQYFFLDLMTGRFQWEEFVRQGAFMAGTAVLPTFWWLLPIRVTIVSSIRMLAGQVGATSLAGAASGLAVIRQGASMVAALLMASAVGSAITADLGHERCAKRPTPWR